MYRKNRRMAFALAAAAGLMALGPVQAMANPNLQYFRAACGDGVVTDFVDEGNPQNRIQESDKVVKTTLPPAGVTEVVGGEIIKITGLRPIQAAGGGWQDLSFRMNTNLPPDRIFVVLWLSYPDKPDARVTIALSEFPSPPPMLDGWRTITLKAQDVGAPAENALLKKVGLIVHSYNNLAINKAKFGKIVVHHVGQNTEDDANLGFQLQSACGLTGL